MHHKMCNLVAYVAWEPAAILLCTQADEDGCIDACVGVPQAQLQPLCGEQGFGMGQLDHGVPFGWRTPFDLDQSVTTVCSLWEACKLGAALQVSDDCWPGAFKALGGIKIWHKYGLVDLWEAVSMNIFCHKAAVVQAARKGLPFPKPRPVDATYFLPSLASADGLLLKLLIQ